MGNCKQNFEDAPLGLKCKQIADRFTALLNRELQRQGLTYSQLVLLTAVAKRLEQNGEVRQKDLCEALQVAHPTIVGLISRMEEKDLLRQTEDPANRRRKTITLTQHGKDVLQTNWDSLQETEKSLVRGFSEEETAALHSLLTRLYRNMDTAGERPAGEDIQA